ncbi:MAG TPA: hypothetical protein VH024_17475 [Candidatus Angelobacter sp.]|nr:hypothetical protein [Candidatus Angelobacter sp.]
MANFSCNNGLGGSLQTITSAYKTLAEVTAQTTSLKRGKLYDVTFGTIGTPADQTYEWDISRATTVGTGTTVTPVAVDSADAAAFTVGSVNHTAEPTYTAASSLFYLGTNQRASYRWVAAPGSELMWPATNLNGLGLRTRSVSGGAATSTAHFLFQEQ